MLDCEERIAKTDVKPTRRAFLAASAAIASSSRSPGPESSVGWSDLDREIWEHELAGFVPPKIFDVHTHLYRQEFDLERRPRKPSLFPNSDLGLNARWENLLLPGRQVSRLAFSSPFFKCDFQKANEFVAAEIRKDPRSRALMLVHPFMQAGHVEAAVRKHRFLGFKPYRRYCSGGDINQCRIADFMPEHQLAVADRYGLIVMLHISMKKSIADPRNIATSCACAKNFAT